MPWCSSCSRVTMEGKSVITYHYSSTFIPFLPCPVRPSAAPKQQPFDFPPQPLHASSHAASHHRRPVRITLHIWRKGTKLPYWSLHYAICNPPTLLLHIPQTQGATNTYPPGLPRDIARYRRRLSSDVCCCFSLSTVEGRPVHQVGAFSSKVPTGLLLATYHPESL